MSGQIDRIACPWLIRRFIDPEVSFLYVPTERVFDVAASTGAIASANFPDDHAMLEHGLVMYDAFYAWCRTCQGETHNWTLAAKR